mgnify:CR=1 FL=1
MSGSTDELADRLARLEEHVAHQQRTIEEMSDQLNEQWKAIERLQTRQEKLIERFIAVEDQIRETPPVTKPPHY